MYIDLNQQNAASQQPAKRLNSISAQAASTASAVSTVPTAEVPAESAAAIASPLLPEPLPEFAGYRILPTSRSGLGHIEQKVLQALDKINNLPVEQVLADSSATLTATRELMQQSQSLVQSLDALVKADTTQQLPAEVNKSLADLRKTLAGLKPRISGL